MPPNVLPTYRATKMISFGIEIWSYTFRCTSYLPCNQEHALSYRDLVMRLPNALPTYRATKRYNYSMGRALSDEQYTRVWDSLFPPDGDAHAVVRRAQPGRGGGRGDAAQA